MNSTTPRQTPETDDNLSYGGTLVTADFARKLERERDEAREYAERCKKGCINLSFAIDRIDYACGEPNEFEASDYALHQNEKHVVHRVKEKFEATRNERDEAFSLLTAEKSTRNAIIKKGVELEKKLEAMREAIKDAHYALAYVYNHGEGSCAFPFRTEDDLCSENRFHHVKDALDALKPFLP